MTIQSMTLQLMTLGNPLWVPSIHHIGYLSPYRDQSITRNAASSPPSLLYCGLIFGLLFVSGWFCRVHLHESRYWELAVSGSWCGVMAGQWVTIPKLRLQSQHHDFYFEVIVREIAWNGIESGLLTWFQFISRICINMVMIWWWRLTRGNDPPSKGEPAFLCDSRNKRQRCTHSLKTVSEKLTTERGKRRKKNRKNFAAAIPLICIYFTPSVVRMRKI